ncbi:hypothetical protein [Paraburkholderia sp. BR14374]|uniref:hypothetical protein n=1 Tax=Paraburkholderia sp. BR14374 TaxID=3237007 RepID=UPI0034CF688C
MIVYLWIESVDAQRLLNNGHPWKSGTGKPFIGITGMNFRIATKQDPLSDP